VISIFENFAQTLVLSFFGSEQADTRTLDDQFSRVISLEIP
jgi:hypothetical protein